MPPLANIWYLLRRNNMESCCHMTPQRSRDGAILSGPVRNYDDVFMGGQDGADQRQILVCGNGGARARRSLYQFDRPGAASGARPAWRRRGVQALEWDQRAAGPTPRSTAREPDMIGANASSPQCGTAVSEREPMAILPPFGSIAMVCAQHDRRLGGESPLGSWSQRPERTTR